MKFNIGDLVQINFYLPNVVIGTVEVISTLNGVNTLNGVKAYHIKILYASNFNNEGGFIIPALEEWLIDCPKNLKSFI